MPWKSLIYLVNNIGNLNHLQALILMEKEKNKENRSKGAGRNCMFTFPSALILISCPPFYHAMLCPANCSQKTQKRIKQTEWVESSAGLPSCVSFSKAADTYVDNTHKRIETRLTGLLIHRASRGFQEYLLFITIRHIHMQRTYSHYSHTNIHKKSQSLGLFWKAECTFKLSCELKLCLCFTLICHFSFVQTLRPAYLNNTVAPLNCKTNTAHIFAGLSAFSFIRFIGILECTFFSLKWIWIWHLRVK